MRRLNLVWIVLALMVATAGPTAAQFTQGNLVVLRVGDGSAALAAPATPVFIDQFSLTGTPGLTIPIPSTGNPLTVSGSANSEGFLSRSLDGQFLLFGGYNAAPGTIVVLADSTTAPRVVVRIDGAGTVQSSNLGAVYSQSNIRSAASTNGTDIWVAGNAGGGLGATAGTRHHVFGSGTTTQLNATTTNNRVVTIFNNQLYVSSMTGTNLGLNTVGTGLSTTSGQTLTQLPGFPTTGNTSAYGSFGLDNPLNPFVGIDTFYVADDQAAAGGGGLQRWVFNGTIWNNTGSVAAGTNSLRGVTASVAGDTVTLFGTTNEASANRLVTITDVLTAAGGTFNPAGFTTLGTAPLNTAFRGVAFAPVPEPSSILAVCGVGFGAAAWLRRRLRKPTTRAEVFV